MSIAGTGMSLSEAARASRASRENVSRERSKEIKEKENERTRQTQPRPARARSADMRKDNNNVQPTAAGAAAAAAPKSPETQPQPSTAKRTRDARATSAKEARTPVKAPVEASKSAKNKTTDEVKPKVANVKLEPPPSVQVSPADPEPETDCNVTIEDTKAEMVAPVAPADVDLMMNSLPSDLPDVQVPLSTTNDVIVIAQSDVSNAEQAVESTASGATTPSEGSVSGDAPTQSRKIISSEEEARAALAEKRRLAREQMEREAERERLRIEEELRLEEERQRQEEIEQKLAEEEMDRLALEARKAEEERLQKYVPFSNVVFNKVLICLFISYRAIEETQRREEEERIRREEEVRQRAEKEQQDRKAREEADKLRKENEERLRREEEEREERRKRVKAIMDRTRGKSGGPGKSGNDTVSGGQSTTDVTAVGISNSISQPDLLGDIVNKTNGGSSSNGQSPTDDSVEIKKNNGFHIDATDSSSSASTTSDLPDISNVIANSTNADSVNSNANNNIADEHVELVA